MKGHASGVWRATPVNLLEHDGRRYLVSVRGHGHWVRNLRAAGTGELRAGKRAEAFRSRELTDDEKVPVLRAYLTRWKVKVSPFSTVSDQTPATNSYALSQPITPPSKSSPWPDRSARRRQHPLLGR
ncbi:MAG TPA: nitroreductase/quinone reductase family protein [Pseudonocardiaceae bacterium]|nr:nitroreductase/quinone reductase family protein [Pseudonocardiaceae bacterium]